MTRRNFMFAFSCVNAIDLNSICIYGACIYIYLYMRSPSNCDLKEV